MAFINAIDAVQQGTQYLSSAGVWSGVDASTSGYLLTSNGTGVAPSFQIPAVPSTIAITAKTDNVTYYPVFTTADTTQTAGAIDVDGNGYLNYNPSTGVLNTKQLSVNSALNSDAQAEITTSNAYALLIEGTATSVDGSTNQLGVYCVQSFNPTNGSNQTAAIQISTTMVAPSAKTMTIAAGLISYINYSTNVGTITNGYGIYVPSSSAGAGTITNAYGGYFNAPAAGTNKIALYADNLSIGYSTQTPPSSGLVVSGKVAFGTNAVNTNAYFEIAGATSAYPIYSFNDVTGVDGSNNQYMFYSANFINPPNGSTDTNIIYLEDTFQIPTGKTTTALSYLNILPNINGNLGTISTVYGVYVQPIANFGGTVSLIYSGYFSNPGRGIKQIALYADNMAIGTTNTIPPTNGLLVNGVVKNTNLTAHGVMYADGSQQMQSLDSAGTTGEILVSTGYTTAPSFKTLGQGVYAITQITNASSPYTVLSTDDIVECDSTGGTITVDLPNAPTTGKSFVIKDYKGSASTHNVTITTVGGTVTIDGSTSVVESTNYFFAQVVFDGSNYIII
ncbi:MAG: hypothetical protein KGI50_05225 [Patescibacteria group bacterium]|nr:hypothetical protein [Patescibacteria group bacterium]MDE2438739.1 hypothetical protein [Patescibacteria group bacterium]